MEQAQDPGRLCQHCGTVLNGETTDGLCPRCLLRMNLASRTMPGGEPSPQVPPPTPEEMAARFPQFEILECLGRGGMGIVYKARQKALDRLVAIKVLAGERRDDPQFEARFEKEARTLAKLSHPNIVTVHDFGESDGMFYLVMEFVDGVNLRDILRDGSMEPAQALAIVPEICEALQFAHDHGVVHRDIKPENILIDRDGRVKIADFGIAALVGTDADHSGTPSYMAPEQEAAKGTIDHRADIYALGVVFYEMLTGERPDKDLVAPSRKVEIDVRIDELVLRALEREPERRYQTAGEFRTVVQTMAATAPSNSNSHVESQSEKFPDDGRKSQAGPRLNLTECQRRRMLWYGFTVSLIGLPAGLVLNLPLVWGLSIAGILIAGMRLGLDRAFQRHLRKPAVVLPHSEGTPPNRAFVIVGRRGNKPAIHWSGVVLVFFIILAVVQTGGALFCSALGTPMDARAVLIGFLATVMAIGIGLARARTVPVERLVDLDKTATSMPDEAAGSPPPLKARATPGMFHRFWWLFSAFLILGPLIGAVTGLGLILPKGEDVIHTVTSVFDVKGSERELNAAVAQVTSPSTFDEVSRQLDLAHEWNCETDEVALRLRQLILVEPVVHTNLIRVKVHQVRRSPQAESARIADAIRVALVDQPDGPVISLIGWEYEKPSKIESALPVAFGAVVGLLLFPLLATLIIRTLHRLFPEPRSRRWTASVAGALVIALVLTIGTGIKFLADIQTANLVHLPPGPVRDEALNTPEHTARSFMEAMRDGDIDAAMAWIDPDMKEPQRLRPMLELASKELREEAYVGKLDRLTRFTEWYPEHRDKDTRFLAVRVAAPDGENAEATTRGLYLILASTPKGWRVARFDDAGGGYSLAGYLREFLNDQNRGNPRNAMVGKWEAPDGKTRIEFFPDGTMTIFDGSMTVGGNYTLLDDDRVKTVINAFGTSVVETIQVSVNGDVMTTIDERGNKEEMTRVRIDDPPADPPKTTGATPKTMSPPEGAEIRRFVLELPVQPPLVVPKDSPLTIDQVKEVLNGVTWGKLLAALAEDGKGDGITVREIPSPGEKNNRYEIAFNYATGQMLMELTVDWRFRSAEPSRLRPVGMPDKVLTHFSEFLPQLAIRYAMLTGHEAATPVVEEAKAKVRQVQDRKTLQQYARALILYQESMGSFPPDLATLLDGDYPGKKPWEELKNDGLMQNHQSGKMERPVYHGSKDLRDRDHDGSEYILVAAPSADRTGKRLVAFLDGSVKVINDPEYLMQVAKQIAAVPQAIKLSITPESIFFDGHPISLQVMSEEMKQWPPETPIQITAARTTDPKTISGIMEICRNANLKNITFAPDPAGETVAAVVQSLAKKLSGIAANYPELATYKEAEANLGDSLFYSQNFVQPTKEKRGIKDSDFGNNGCYINFATAPIPPRDHAYAMTEPTLELENLGLYLWAEIRTGATPSKGFRNEIQELLSSHAEMLKAMDGKK